MKRFEDLRVWQEARIMARVTREVVAGFGRRRDLVDQMERAANSVSANIAEGSSRGSDADFRRYLRYARSSCDELRSHLYEASDSALVEAPLRDELFHRLESTGKMLTVLIRVLGRGT